MTADQTTDLRLHTHDGTLVYDVRGPLPPAAGRPVLLMVGSPMDAGGFATLATYFTDRTVVTYDPRGLGRSTRTDGRDDLTPETNAEDIHRVIEAVGGGPVEVFASSGGAVSALALVVAHPGDVSVLVAHEPPAMPMLPDADLAAAGFERVRAAYNEGGRGPGMAAFIGFTSWQGEYTDEFLAAPLPDPATFGMPSDDDGTRDDPLLSRRSEAIASYRPDLDGLRSSPTRVVIAAGVESAGTFTGRTSQATAAALGQGLAEFPSHHGGFLGGEHGYAGEPDAFAARLREVLDA